MQSPRCILGVAAALFATCLWAQDPIDAGQPSYGRLEAQVAKPVVPDLDFPAPPKGILTGDPKVFPQVPKGVETLAQPVCAPTEPNPGAGQVPAAGVFTFFKNSAANIPSGSRSTTGEPTAVIARDTALYTGNWYAGISRDNCQTWTYLNPYTRFTARDGGFCCDQRTLHVPQAGSGAGMVVWLLEYSYSATTQLGSLRIARAQGRDGLRDDTWSYWDLTPSFFGLGTSRFLDYSDIAYSNGFLYGSCIIGLPPNSSGGLLMYRIPIADLWAGGTINVAWYTSTTLGGYGSYRFAQGSTSTMYWAAHTSTSNLRVYTWTDAGASASINDRAVPAWSATPTAAPGPDARDWTGFGYTVNTVLSGHATPSEIGFWWTSGSISGRPQTFVRCARFNPAGLALSSTLDIFSSTVAWHFPAVAVNSLGHIGGVLNYGGGGFYPSVTAFLGDGYSPLAAPLANYGVRGGTAGPTANRWGDYLQVSQSSSDARTFVAASYTMQGTTVEPWYSWFGRDDYTPYYPNLGVTSTPISGVAITVDETDRLGNKNGSTPFTRYYYQYQGYTLTAPLQVTSGPTTYRFKQWSGTDGTRPIGQRVYEVANIYTADDTANAAYAAERTLTVQSTNPAAGVSITVSPADLNSATNGTTPFSRLYYDAEVVTLTAPATYSGVPFKRWRLDGVNQTLGVTTLNVTLSASRTAIADYYLRSVGSISSFGAGCKGSNNLVPVHSASAPKGYPFLGDTTTYTLSVARANTAAVLYLGASNTTWGAYPLPLALGFIGITGCSLNVSLDISVGTTTNASGVANVPIVTPNSPALVGRRAYTQMAFIDAGAPYLIPVPHTNGLNLLVGGDI